MCYVNGVVLNDNVYGITDSRTDWSLENVKELNQHIFYDFTKQRK